MGINWNNVIKNQMKGMNPVSAFYREEQRMRQERIKNTNRRKDASSSERQKECTFGKEGKTITISTELEEKMMEAFRNELDYRLFEEPEYAPEYQTEITVKIELLKLLGLNKMAKEYEKENKAIMDKYIPDIVYEDDKDL